MSSPRSMLLVEDDDVVRAQVSMFFESSPVEISVTACADVTSAIESILGGAEFEVALVDLGLPDGSGVEVIRCLRAERPACPAIVFSIYGDDVALFDALRAGARGYLLKETPPDALLDALTDALAGGAPMTPAIARRVVESFAVADLPSEPLSKREREVLALLARGHTYQDIASALEIGLGTVQGYVKLIYRKLEVSTKAEATAVAVQLGIR